jgi:hypothetical protein
MQACHTYPTSKLSSLAPGGSGEGRQDSPAARTGRPSRSGPVTRSVPWETGGLIAAGGGVVADRCGVGEAWGCGVAAVLVHAATRARTSAVTPVRDAALMRVIAVSLSCPLSFSLG